MKNRPVAHITQAEHLNMGSTVVKQPLPTVKVEQVDPFLLLHHFGPTTTAPGSDPLDVGPHPHRGFEPVTFLYSGGIRHKDSRGNEGLLRGGDVQWMTAGLGIIHSERASREFLEAGGTMEGIQLWVNLPRKHKMAQPNYQDIKAAQIPEILNWRLSRARVLPWDNAGVSPWTYVWEQEFASLDDLLGPYMMHPHHWAHIDRWFDLESGVQALDVNLSHAFCPVAQSILSAEATPP